MIDGERVIRRYLNQHPAFAALGVEIRGDTPKDTDSAWIRLTQLDAADVQRSMPRHLIEFYFQLDCYGSKAGIEGSQRREAAQIASVVCDALADLNRGSYQTSGAVITGCDPNMGMRRPDPDIKRERYIATARMWAHP